MSAYGLLMWKEGTLGLNVYQYATSEENLYSKEEEKKKDKKEEEEKKHASTFWHKVLIYKITKLDH